MTKKVFENRNLQNIQRESTHFFDHLKLRVQESQVISPDCDSRAANESPHPLDPPVASAFLSEIASPIHDSKTSSSSSSSSRSIEKRHLQSVIEKLNLPSNEQEEPTGAEPESESDSSGPGSLHDGKPIAYSLADSK
ncbi:hypothetical protein CMV_027386 [Castanea mollissima]|uniref:Uncharacterized protein n=1 Tax=Castanea mollissima TaxID=60419 RepID=A0A8J4QAF9_9ROSI|nr:hypothetical protein CMV_027386 [Castanea mollissima]